MVAAEGKQLSLKGLPDFLRNEQRIALYKLPEYLMPLRYCRATRSARY